MSGESRLLRFANTRCKVIEVFVRRQLSRPIIEAVRGVVYAFDEEGRLDLSDVEEAMEMVTQGSQPRRLQENVIDMSPVLRDRRWSATHTRQPTAEMIALIKADLQGAKGILPEGIEVGWTPFTGNIFKNLKKSAKIPTRHTHALSPP